MMKSDLLEEKKDTAGSVAALETAYSFAPFDQELNYSLAYKYAESKNQKVLALCDSLLKRNSLKPPAEPYYFKGIYYSNINQHEKAIDLFNLAIQHDFNFHNAYIEKGKILYDQKKIKDALKVFTLVSTISPPLLMLITGSLNASSQAANILKQKKTINAPTVLINHLRKRKILLIRLIDL
ncbi:MAG: hypothetical protein WDO19_06965 [Bacteroidota bacterium]